MTWYKQNLEVTGYKQNARFDLVIAVSHATLVKTTDCQITPPPPAAHWCRSKTSPPSLELCHTLHCLELPGIGQLIRLDRPLPHSSWYNTRTRRLTFAAVLLEIPWTLDDSPPGLTLPHLPGIIPGPQDSTFLAAASGGYIQTTRYCVCLAENSFIPPGIVHVCLAENSFIPPGIVHMFQRTVFIPPSILRMFQRTVLIPPGIVHIFREQFLYHLVL